MKYSSWIKSTRSRDPIGHREVVIGDQNDYSEISIALWSSGRLIFQIFVALVTSFYSRVYCSEKPRIAKSLKVT